MKTSYTYNLQRESGIEEDLQKDWERERNSQIDIDNHFLKQENEELKNQLTLQKEIIEIAINYIEAPSKIELEIFSRKFEEKLNSYKEKYK